MNLFFKLNVLKFQNLKKYLQKKLETAVSEDEYDVDSSGLGNEVLSPAPGGPFSALTPSMWPQDILAKLSEQDDSNSQLEYRFDEFGFKIDEEDGLEHNSKTHLDVPFVEDPQQR